MMSRCVRVLAAGLFLLSIISTSVSVRAAEPNLIANPSAETANGNQPADWTANAWGSTTANLTHATTGHTGNRSLRVDVTAHTDGDAKWMHAPVAVDGSTSYTYTGWYKSNVDTEHVLQYTAANGTTTYEFGQIVPASNSWEQTSLTFTTPANVAKVVVFHIVLSVGWLQTDDHKLTTTHTPQPPAGNLLANPSFETANDTLPAGWASNKWGNNTADFTYETAGRTGLRSAKVHMTAHTDGDAKWYADTVEVTAGKTYTYSDYYKATIPTQVVAAYQNNAGDYKYVELEGAPTASNWSLYSNSFTVPDTIVAVSIYHVIAGVGSLTIDDASLTPSASQAPTIPNPSVEEGTTSPTAWQSSSWGNNTPTFEYVNGGHTGSKSVKVTVANHETGDAKWLFNPISLQTGKQYRFSVWYKSNVTPKAVAMFTKADGTATYHGMPKPTPPANATTAWQNFSDSFNVPDGTQAVSVFLFIDRNGWLQTDDYAVEPYAPTGFNRPLLSLTFDDGHEDNVTTALPLLNQYDFKTTHCFATTFIEGQPKQAQDNVHAFFNSGHEICSHSVTHPHMTTLTDAQLDYEARHSKEYLESLIGRPITNFATPFGDYDARVNNVLDDYYQAHRTVDEGFNSKDNFNQYRLRVQNITKDTTAAEVTAWINRAKADKTWLILVYHRVADDPGQFDSYKDIFAEHLQAIQASGITVKTYQDALTETTNQL